MSLNSFGQALTAHQIRLNDVEDFAFDPPYLIKGEGAKTLNDPQSVRSHPTLNATRGYAHNTIVDHKVLAVGNNNPNPGFIGIQSFTRESTPVNSPFDNATHILIDISNDGIADALIADRGHSSLQVILGQDSASAAFQDTIKTVEFDAAIQDLAGVAGRFVAVGVLHAGFLRVFLSESSAGDGAVDKFIDRTGQQMRFRGRGLRVAAHTVRSGILFSVLSEDNNALRLTTITADISGATIRQRDSVLFTDSNDNRERGVAVALSNLDGDALPEVVVLSAVLEDNDNVPDAGRLRVFDVSDRWRLRLQEQGSTAGVDVEPMLSPGQLAVTDCVDPVNAISPTALRVADIAAPRGRQGPDGRGDIVVAGNIGLLKCNATRPFAQIWNVNERLQLQKTAETVVIETTNEAMAEQPNVTDLEVTRFNADELPDVALLDRASNGLIILRQQPRPCITFITSITHGHQGGNSILAEASRLLPGSGLGDGTVPAVTYNDDYNAMLTERVAAINQARRTPDAGANPPRPELCPTAHIAVNGHWEQGTSFGALGHVVGRAGWIFSSLVPTPSCFPLVTPVPHPEPIGYWLSAFWLLVPPPPVNLDLDCLVPLPNYASRAQFFLAGVAGATEWVALMISGTASRIAATDLSAVIDRGVRVARRSMDTCTGQIALDTVGFSRGTAVTSATMQQVNIAPLRFNADASIIYLDAIDPSWGPPSLPFPASLTVWFNGDSIRPWAKSGFFVNDPPVTTAGSARISSVFAGRPDELLTGLNPAIGAAEMALNPLPPSVGAVSVHRDVIGLPSGYDRRGTLSVPTGGWFATAPALTHGGVRNGMLLSGIPPEGTPAGYIAQGTGGPAPGFANGTHIGPFLVDPFTPVPDFPGWRRNAITGFNDAASLPAECQPDGDADGRSADDIDDGGGVADAVQDEFVADPEFNLAHGIVANARDLIELTDGLSPANKDYFFDQLIPGDESKPIRQYILAAADKGLPPGEGAGSWSAPASCTSCPRMVSDGDESRLPQFRDRLVQHLPIPADGGDVQGIAELRDAWTAASTEQGDNPKGDRLHLYGLLAAGATRLDDAQLEFGNSAAKLVQYLLPYSQTHNRLVVRVFYERITSDGSLEIRLQGAGLDMTGVIEDTEPGKLSELMFEAERIPTAELGSVKTDALTLTGRRVRISSISIRPARPWKHPDNNLHYEIIHLPHGVDWQAAYNMARRKSFDGRRGRLAEFPGNNHDDIAKILEELNASYPVWLGASGETGDANSLRWLSGDGVASSEIDTGAESPEEKRSYLFVHPDGRLASSGLRASVAGQSIGCLVEY